MAGNFTVGVTVRAHLRATLMGSGLLIAVLGLAAAAGSLTLLGRAGAAISSPPAGPADQARERGQEAPALLHGAAGGAGNTAQRPR